MALVAYFLIILLLVGAMLGLSYVLGQRHNDPATGTPYEGGIISEGSARVRFPAEFYLVAVFFVIFDLETVFLFAWALESRALGWVGYVEALVFAGVLMITLAYLWGVGALDWGHRHAVARAGGRT